MFAYVTNSKESMRGQSFGLEGGSYGQNKS